MVCGLAACLASGSACKKTADTSILQDADFKVPAYVELRDEPLPRNPAGKVLKAQLRGDATAFAAHDDAVL